MTDDSYATTDNITLVNNAKQLVDNPAFNAIMEHLNTEAVSNLIEGSADAATDNHKSVRAIMLVRDRVATLATTQPKDLM